MRQCIWRPLLILALLVPLSRLSFGDDTFAVSGSISDSGDIEFGSMAIPGLISNGTYEGWEGGSPSEWGGFGNLLTIGSEADPGVGIYGTSGAFWSFEGISGQLSSGEFSAEGGTCTVGEDGCSAPGTWTGEIDLDGDSFNDVLFKIQMAGVGTVSYSGDYVPEIDALVLINGGADLTGVGQVIYEDPSVPEPGTLSLMMVAGIASILAMGFRRIKATQN